MIEKGKIAFSNGYKKIEEINPRFDKHIEDLKKIHNETFEDLVELATKFINEDN